MLNKFYFITIIIIFHFFSQKYVVNDKAKTSNDENKIPVILKVKILNAKKKFDYNAAFYKEYSNTCDNWILSKKNIEDIILKSKFIEGAEFHYNFDVLPCFYEGDAIINDTTLVAFEVNSGSSTVIVRQTEFFMLGYYGKKKYFISKPTR